MRIINELSRITDEGNCRDETCVITLHLIVCQVCQLPCNEDIFVQAQRLSYLRSTIKKYTVNSHWLYLTHVCHVLPPSHVMLSSDMFDNDTRMFRRHIFVHTHS